MIQRRLRNGDKRRIASWVSFKHALFEQLVDPRVHLGDAESLTHVGNQEAGFDKLLMGKRSEDLLIISIQLRPDGFGRGKEDVVGQRVAFGRTGIRSGCLFKGHAVLPAWKALIVEVLARQA